MKGRPLDHERSRTLARNLRREPTEAERLLWRYLRHEQLGVKFRRQHTYGNFILDFASIEARLVVELDGGQHAESLTYDAERTRFLEQAGFRVLRFWNNQVFENLEGVLETIREALAGNPPPSRPSP
jgi:crossover junction endodeoxyribonuclease RuvC